MVLEIRRLYQLCKSVTVFNGHSLVAMFGVGYCDLVQNVCTLKISAMPFVHYKVYFFNLKPVWEFRNYNHVLF